MNDPIFRLPLGEWADSVVAWLKQTIGFVFDFFKLVFEGIVEGLQWVLATPPFYVVIAILVVLAYVVKGWKLALGTLIGLLFVYSMDQWHNTMLTLGLVLVATVLAVAIGIPLGIWAAVNPRVSAFMRPVLDLMQTLPAFVYLIPAVVFFRSGIMPGVVATIIFALPPAVRMTELGIKQVDSEVVEAGHAFGSTPRRILRQIQLPLAMPTIMAGVNQVIMLALSMVVISGMVGAPGLGQEVYGAVTRVNIGLGFEAGLSVVIIAMFLDRMTTALSSHSAVEKANRLATR
ncbi:L-proline glycine betaine ABC transport system permease protein ProW (TC 3.A.1.12.1) [Actinomycetales bacterium JB111]|nr:L-proline glycine betaine ABC transport system permease protein ProW (TC 3.A.1.12.1) [Actinomycetales bacterium JB111]